MPSPADLLLLADGRLPAGGHAHSGGLEQAVEMGDVHDAASLEAFLDGILQATAHTSIAAAAAAAYAWAAGNGSALLELDAEESARMPSAALRTASRAQGRQLLRAAHAYHGPHLSLAQGVTAARLELSPADAGRLAAYAAVTGPATAAVRLLGLDPFSVHGVVARVMERAEPLVLHAATHASSPAFLLPGGAAPLLEIGGELHRAREIRMFAS
jgi:urease accessory protein